MTDSISLRDASTGSISQFVVIFKSSSANTFKGSNIATIMRFPSFLIGITLCRFINCSGMLFMSLTSILSDSVT